MRHQHACAWLLASPLGVLIKHPSTPPAFCSQDTAARPPHTQGLCTPSSLPTPTPPLRCQVQFFLADMRWEHVERAQRLLVPVLVLRDHDDFDPLQPGHAGSLDWDLLTAQAARLVGPRQELLMTKVGRPSRAAAIGAMLSPGVLA